MQTIRLWTCRRVLDHHQLRAVPCRCPVPRTAAVPSASSRGLVRRIDPGPRHHPAAQGRRLRVEALDGAAHLVGADDALRDQQLADRDLQPLVIGQRRIGVRQRRMRG